MKRIVKYIIATVVAFLLLSVAGFFLWANSPLGPDQVALNALESDSQVEVKQDNWLVFEPTINPTDKGIIFYPGGRVDYRSYAPLAHKLASAGYKVVIVPMPLNLAFFAPDRADEVIAAYSEIKHWVIGGHSLGGSMAANYVFNNPSAVDALILWASYPADSNNLSDTNIPCASIYGSLDGQVNAIRESYTLLPENTFWKEIEGANHAQFGWYGSQSGDNSPQIGHLEQEDAIVEATLEFLESIRGNSQ